ncbi:proto-oncogene tyrosine-protein kinase receptor Ret isoform X1 [Odontomachus brunneus]|uniref:proto-oncogene tyrosine-protein kinase receptor Ret isoform X1 n=1 Tax=Odontomachus brunneus TaxID=486640 RepID=UPI0013F18F0C|nr:proto-oncogene tyrosine-protein kinase receptor Ret isoform X1 [Odontomachus brunneus]
MTHHIFQGLYFPQSNLTLRLPYLARQSAVVSLEVKLIDLRTLRNDYGAAKNAKYQLYTNSRKFAIQQNSIVLQGLKKNGVDTVIVEASEEGFGKAVLDIQVQPVAVTAETINCTDFLQDMCFWNTSIYKIYENQPVTMIGTFGPEAYGYVCPEFNVTRYELLNGKNYFHTVDGKLFANASLDRDVRGPPGGPGPRVIVKVNCVVWESTGRQYTQTRDITIDILDQNDNPPVVQGNKSIAMELRDFTVGDLLINNLILTDADAMTTNQYSLNLLGEAHDAFNISYDTLPIEHEKRPKDVPSTAIIVRIHAGKTLLPKSPCRVLLRAVDESLLPNYGPNVLLVNLTFTGPVHQTFMTTKSATPTTQEPVTFPTSVEIARISPRYFRVTEPAVKLQSSRTFILYGSSAFNVTQRSGIVYVSNETLLRSEQTSIILLKLKWGEEKRAEWMLLVNLIDVPPSKTNTCKPTQKEMHSCANAHSYDQCVQSCGTASGVFSNGSFVGRCAWRGDDSNETIAFQMSDYYSTCSPTLAYCPDNECDELESSDSRICPQDCVAKSDVHFAESNEDGRGIKTGLGICACNDLLKCTCGPDTFRHVNNVPGVKEKRLGAGKLRDRDNEVVVSGARKVSSNPCGPTCMMGVIGASLFVLIVIVGSFVMWRYRRAAKGARRECKHRVDDAANGIGILPSDYIDRGDGLLIGLDTFTAANRHLLLPKTCPPDPKWEFPRSRLTIEQVLGEGEFGRVLRAKAVDIGGWPGPTTVAVKTLKEDACASELADLLSEYQLLKEAQHPNVIRLLGACTTPGAPVYLIIEFAEFGSLRNYLRRSRNLKTEGRTVCSASLPSASLGNHAGEELRCADNASNYTITPHDILSFAWQISKGMAYLADIKLVHRDLAARNVLLATGKVCKISDFGLTRDVYEDDAYLKRSKGRVPVKWMAPESLADHVYTSKSDVWSFGVLLWELVTLGASPYPGVDVHNLYNLLKTGYRMERPVNCSQQLYKLMMSCWHLEPGMRPSFKELTCHWERMLEDGVEYLDLNPRTVHNQAYFESLHSLGRTDDSDDDLMGNRTVSKLKTDTVNYLGRMSSEPVTKCDKVDKLQALWQMSITSFPEEPIKSPYVNDRHERPASLNTNHYESPIKLRNTSVISNSENDLKVTTQERPQSYIDMEGKKSAETEDLLVFGSMDDDKNDNNVTN